ncbi:MAG: hypothetical protein ACLFR5_03525 [Halobacteriales archaeon]
MSLNDSTLIRLVLILVVIWLALNVLGEVLNLLANSVIAAGVALLLILWYLDYI